MSEFVCQTCDYSGPNPELLRLAASIEGGPGGMAWHCPNCFAMTRRHNPDGEKPAIKSAFSSTIHVNTPPMASQSLVLEGQLLKVDFLSQARARMDEIRIQLSAAEALKAELKMLEKFFGVKSRKPRKQTRKASPRLKAVGT